MGKMQQFKREIRSANGKMFAFDLRSGFGAALGGLFERVARGKVHDAEIREVYGLEDDDQATGQQIRMNAGPQRTPSAKTGKYTALVSLHGVALYDFEWQPYAFSTLLLSQIMDNLANDPAIDTIVLDINTPGGHVTGTQEAADAVYRAAKKKNVVGIINPLCASAGYWIGSQCTKLIAVPSADVGSIGVFMTHYDCSAMLADAGIKPTFIYAGEYKTEGNSMEPLGEEARAFYQAEVDQTYDDFLSAVARGRGINKDKVRDTFGKGRCYSAPVAKRIGMVDEIATIKIALQGVGLTLEMPQDGRRRRGEADEPEQSSDTSGSDGDTGSLSAQDVADGIRQTVNTVIEKDAAALSAVSAQLAEAAESASFAFPVLSSEGCASVAFEKREISGKGTFFVQAEWPTRAVFSAFAIAADLDPVRSVGSTLTIACENGAAVYHQYGLTEQGDWICALAPNSSFSAPPLAADENAGRELRERQAAVARARLALLSA